MIWPFSLYKKLMVLEASNEALTARAKVLALELESLKAERDGLLDRLLIATGTPAMTEPLSSPQRVQAESEGAQAQAFQARNMRDYQRFAEAALAFPVTQVHPLKGNLR
jgi:hypothetical protein